MCESVAGESLLVKFHGDTSVPDSLVFGTRSYQARMANEDNHPLDIKLRSDLLGKRLMFLGDISLPCNSRPKATVSPSYLWRFEVALERQTDPAAAARNSITAVSAQTMRDAH